jgi:hypothetical protein
MGFIRSRQKNKGLRCLAFGLPSLQRLGMGGTRVLRKIVTDVLVELELSLNVCRALRAAELVHRQSLRQRAALGGFEQIAQGLVESKFGAGVRHKKAAQSLIEPPARANHRFRRQGVRHRPLVGSGAPGGQGAARQANQHARRQVLLAAACGPVLQAAKVLQLFFEPVPRTEGLRR